MLVGAGISFATVLVALGTWCVRPRGAFGPCHPGDLLAVRLAESIVTYTHVCVCPPPLPPMGSRSPANKGKRLPATVLSRQEVYAVIGAASRRAPTGLRNRALITMLYCTGLRLHVVLSLLPKHVGRDGSLRYPGERGIVLDPFALAVLDDWRECRRSLGLPLEAPLFCTLRGTPLRGSYVRGVLPRLAARAGVTTRVHVEGLRLTYRLERGQQAD